ncbi:MAG: hypothetical protein QM831_04875 [Kofleriaceae bacterium]
MSEMTVDLTYRGLSLGKKLKLTNVRPSTGFVETAIPMPVGTTIGVIVDEYQFDASVTDVKEQVTGASGEAPVPSGMTIRPKLDDKASAWWKGKVTLPDVQRVEAAPVVGIVRSKRSTGAGVPELMDDGRNTAVQQAVNPADLEPEEPKDTQVIPVIDSNPALPAIQDDGRATVAMDAIDLKALGLDPSVSGEIPTIKEDDLESGPTTNGGGTKKKKRRR